MPLWLSTLFIPRYIKLYIQIPVVMEFHSRMGTVNATTMNVGRLLYKEQLFHREGWHDDRVQQTNKQKSIMSPTSTLTLPHTLTYQENKPPKLLATLLLFAFRAANSK